MATKELMVTAPVIVWVWLHLFAGGRGPRPRWLVASLAATWIVFVTLLQRESRGPTIDFTGRSRGDTS